MVSGASIRITSRGVDRGLDLGHALGHALVGDRIVEVAQVVHLVLGVPADPLAAVAELRHQRAKRGEALVEVGIVPLDGDEGRGGLAGDQVALALLPVAHAALGDLGGGVVQDRHRDHVGLDPEHLGRDLGELAGDRLEDLPVRFRLVGRVHRRRQRVDERMHVGGVEVVLLVPGRGRQHDVGIDAGGRHAEVDRHQQVELALAAPRRASGPPSGRRGPPRRGPCRARRARCRAGA